MALPSILFMGTPDFARVILQALHQAGYPIVGVFAQPDKRGGRGQHLLSPPVALYARAHQLPLFQPTSVKDEEVLKTIESFKADLIVVAAYGKILPDRILASARVACVNLHASLLPKYRGASPISAAILSGDLRTGVSLMEVHSQLDAGPVYSTTELEIEPHDTTETLTQKLAVSGAQLLLDSIPNLLQKKLPVPQNESLATYAGMIKKEMAHIDWTQSAVQIERMIRAYQPWPVAYTLIDNQALKIYSALLLDGLHKADKGTIVGISPQGIEVVCGNGILCITEVQLQGRNRMKASDFARGYRLKVGDFFNNK